MATLSYWAQKDALSDEDLQAWINDCRPQASCKSAEELVFLLNALIKRRIGRLPDGSESPKMSVTAAVKELASITGKTISDCYYYRAYRNLLPKLLRLVGTPGPTGLDTSTARELSKFPQDRQMMIYLEAQDHYQSRGGVARSSYLKAREREMKGEPVTIPIVRPRREKILSTAPNAVKQRERRAEAKVEPPKKIWATYTRVED